MADTRPDILLAANTPLDVYAALNAQGGFPAVSVGARLRIQNKSGSQIYSHSQADEPVNGRSGERVEVGEYIETDDETNGEWLFISSIDGRVTVDVVDELSIDGLLNSMVTKPGTNASRFKVDSQPSSYEANEQFKIFYRLQNVPQNQQLVMKFESVNALNIMVRKINVWEGGREYLVYGDDGSHTVTGTFNPIPVYTVNGNVEGGGAHPVSGVTASVAIGAGIFTEGSPPTNGDAAMTDANAARATAQPLADSNQSGVPAGATFYLVFNNIALNDDTNGHYYLQWEERF